MNKEEKLNLNAGDYAIRHCVIDQTYNGLEVHKMLCDAYIAGNNDTLDDEDERIRNEIINYFKCQTRDEPSRKEIHNKWIAWLEKQGENCLVNFDEAEKEKYDFVSGQFIECRKSFNGFKEDNSYWLEYVGDDNYIGRSDNILNQKFHITPRQLFTLFTWQHRPKENNVNEETNAPTGYGKYVDECLNEASKHFFSEGEDKYSVADLFYAGVRCGKSWFEKQAEQELQLKEGKYYECIKSYYYLGGGQYWFDKGKVYFCEKDGYLRSDPNNLIYVYDCENWQSYFRPYIGKSVWSEEDEIGLGDTLWAIKQARTIAKDENDMGNLWYAENWLKSIKSRISLKQEWSEEEIEKAAQEWDSKANFNPFYMTMDGDKPTGVKQDITTHKESFKAVVEWILKKIGF